MKQTANRRWELAGFLTGVEAGIEAFVEDKMHMGPFQAEYRRLSRDVGASAARQQLGLGDT